MIDRQDVETILSFAVVFLIGALGIVVAFAAAGLGIGIAIAIIQEIT